MKYSTVLWDFDGTLAYTGQDVWESLEYGARNLGGRINRTFREDDSNLGRTMDEIFLAVEPYPGKEWQERFEELVRIHYRTISEYAGTVLYPGIPGLLEDLEREGVRNYIVTLKPKEALERILDRKGWKHYFTGWLSPDSFPGRIYTKGQLLAYYLKKTVDMEQIVYVGDTYSDVTACRQNGLACIGVTYGDGNTRALLEAGPDRIAESVRALGKLLKEGI